jgi:uncharacterized membrane protein
MWHEIAFHVRRHRGYTFGVLLEFEWGRASNSVTEITV